MSSCWPRMSRNDKQQQQSRPQHLAQEGTSTTCTHPVLEYGGAPAQQQKAGSWTGTAASPGKAPQPWALQAGGSVWPGGLCAAILHAVVVEQVPTASIDLDILLVLSTANGDTHSLKLVSYRAQVTARMLISNEGTRTT